jgi:hypothetical protein
MVFGLTTATTLWLLIPMPLLMVLSLITFFTEKGEG